MPLPAGLPDVERLTRKLERRRASLADLCQLYRASSRLPMIEQAFREHEGPHAELLTTRRARAMRNAPCPHLAVHWRQRRSPCCRILAFSVSAKIPVPCPVSVVSWCKDNKRYAAFFLGVPCDTSMLHQTSSPSALAAGYSSAI